jgi:hypothetical protein
LLKRLLGQVKTLEDEVAIYSERIAEQMRPYKTQLERLDAIGRIGQRSAENLLAEIGSDMSPFPTDDQLVSWGGLMPWQEPVGRQESVNGHAAGQQVAQAHLNRSGVRREAQERQLSGPRSGGGFGGGRKGRNQSVLRTLAPSFLPAFERSARRPQLEGRATIRTKVSIS